MDKTITSYPNDMVVIEFQPLDLGNNSIILKGVGVLLGKIDSSGLFLSEDGKKKLPLVDNKNALENGHVYAFPVSLEELKVEFHDDNLDNLLTSYYTKINRDMVIGLREKGQVSLFCKSYGEVAPGIGGDLYKRRDDTVRSIATPAPAIIKSSGDKKTLDKIDNIALENHLKARILHNDENIEDIVTTIVGNYEATSPEDVEAILCLGPTGSGKTRTFELISEYLGVPLTIFDCNLLTSAGYVGKDIEDVMLAALNSAGKDPARAEKSIVVLDEIDKLASKGLDVKDSGVQQALLKLLDGYRYSVSPNRSARPIEIDSSFMTFAGLGAFPDVYAAVQKKNGGKMGFGAAVTQDEQPQVVITEDDIVKHGGLLAELVGRFPNMILFPKLGKGDIKDIILHSQDSYFLRKVEKYARLYHAQVSYDDSFIDALVEGAYAKNVGGRSIKKIVAYTFKKADRAILSLDRTTPKVLRLTADTVTDNRKFSL